eukprot:1157440-Pelagomonas_calceolata.AAC.2
MATLVNQQASHPPMPGNKARATSEPWKVAGRASTCTAHVRGSPDSEPAMSTVTWKRLSTVMDQVLLLRRLQTSRLMPCVCMCVRVFARAHRSISASNRQIQRLRPALLNFYPAPLRSCPIWRRHTDGDRQQVSHRKGHN